MNPIEEVKNWLWAVALKKAIGRGIQLVIAWVVALGLNNYGVIIEPEKLTVALMMGLEMLRNWLKIKFPALGKVL